MIKNLLYIAILTSVVVASWIGLSVYHSSTTSTISADANIVIKGITPAFDREMIDKIKSRKKIPVDLNEKKAEITIAPITTTPSPTTTSGKLINL